MRKTKRSYRKTVRGTKTNRSYTKTARGTKTSRRKRTKK